MMHQRRAHKAATIGGSARELVDYVCRSTWTLCTAFKWRDLVLLNDSTSEDGAMEFTVVRLVGGVAIESESITFDWLNSDDARASTADYLEALNAGTKPGIPGTPINLTPHPDGSCRHCA